MIVTVTARNLNSHKLYFGASRNEANQAMLDSQSFQFDWATSDGVTTTMFYMRQRMNDLGWKFDESLDSVSRVSEQIAYFTVTSVMKVYVTPYGRQHNVEIPSNYQIRVDLNND